MKSSINWQELPFFRLLAPYLAGLLAAHFTGPLQSDHLSGITACIILPGFLFSVFFRKTWSGRWYFGAFLQLLLIFAGQARYQALLHQSIPAPNALPAPNSYVLGEIADWPRKGKWITTRIRIAAFRTVNNWQSTPPFLVKARLPPNQETNEIVPGDRILFQHPLQPIPGARNPNTFDQRQFEHFRKTGYQVYLPKGNFFIERARSSNKPLQQPVRSRKFLLEMLAQYLPDTTNFAVAAALVAGYKGFLDSDTRTAYARTGAMHVLAVSGLHVGIIYFLVQKILTVIPYLGSRLIRFPVSILVIWFYALLTGAGPSVLRAATMFSFLIIGNQLGRKGHVFNSLAASAFCLLVINPFLFGQVGFQLSYSAVAGILSFQPILYKGVYFRHWLPDHFWQLLTVSLAAQAGTLPLALFHFQQFPLLFWLSGILVVDAAGIILALGFSLAGSHFFSLPLSHWIACLLNSILNTMNKGIHFLAKLPNGLLEDIKLNETEVLLFYLSLAWAFYMLKYHRTFPLVPILFLFMSCGLWHTARTWQTKNERALVVYDLKKAVVIDLIDRNQLYSLETVPPSDWERQNILLPNRRPYCSNQLHSFSTMPDPLNKTIQIRLPVIRFREMIIWIQSKGTKIPNAAAEPLRPDILIITASNTQKAECLIDALQPKKVILPTQLKPWNRRDWLLACSQNDTACHDIRKEGAFVWHRN